MTSQRLTEVLLGKYQVNEIDIVRQAVHESLEAISGCVDTEVELGSRAREIVKLKMQAATLKMQLKHEQDLVSNLRVDQNHKKRKFDEFQMEFQKTVKALSDEKNKNAENEKKLRLQESRLELLLTDKAITSEDKLRSALSEIMKENELYAGLI